MTNKTDQGSSDIRQPCLCEGRCIGADYLARDWYCKREAKDECPSDIRQEPSPSGSDTPIRVQRQRSKGWRMPANTIYVGRPSKWGNPWSPSGYWEAGYSGDFRVAAAACVEQFRAWMTQTRSAWSGDTPERPWSLCGLPGTGREIPEIASLRGKNLACWCHIDQRCHADVLLELANQPQPVNGPAIRRGSNDKKDT